MIVIAQQKPDFSGEWRLNLQASMLSPIVAPVAQSGVLRIEHHEPKFTAHQAIVLDGKPFESSFDDPETLGLAERCLLGNFGASGGSLASPPMVPSAAIPSFYRIVQTDTHVLIFTEWVHDARVVRLNGTHLPPAIPSWLGDSIGHYEGRTLVVDTANFRRDTHNLDSGERLHVVERLTRVNAKTIWYRVTVEDRDTWANPWTAEWPFKAVDIALFSVECHEGNYAIENFLRGARADEGRAQAPRR